MNKESILKSVYLWAFIMLTTLIATVIYKNEFATPSEFEIYIKGMCCGNRGLIIQRGFQQELLRKIR